MLKAPFPWFGGKSGIAGEVWQRFGDVGSYTEPFAGSAAMLLARPGGARGVETINDADGFVANFWRAVARDFDEVARWADNPVNECDLHARHVWLVGQREDITSRLMGDPDWCDAKVAGWWVWGLCCWIGSGWCSGRGPWTAVGGVFQRGDAGLGVNRKLPHLGDAGRGVNRQLPHLGNAGRGVNRQLPHLGSAGQGDRVRSIMRGLRERLDRVRVACGDWRRVCRPSTRGNARVSAYFMDPPYGEGFDGAYAVTDGVEHDASIAADVWAWAIENGDDPSLRIAVAGYDDGRELPDGWSVLRWEGRDGYSGRGKVANAKRETVWFSPHCSHDGDQPRLL